MTVMVRRLGRFTEYRILTETQEKFSSHKRYSDQWWMFRGM